MTKLVEEKVEAGTGAPVLLVGGPPLAGAQFHGVQRRLGVRSSVVVDLVPGEGSWVERLERAVDEHRPERVFAHGLAVPVALASAKVAALPLLVTNGPVSRVPGLLRAVGRLPWTGASLLRWLESSAGLRRAVVNPYVMDHDTVVALAGPLIGDRAARREVLRWVRDLDSLIAAALPRRGTIALWGDEDRLFPWSEAQALRRLDPFVRLVPLAGGRWLHPVERPWETADLLLSGPAAT